MQHFSGVRLSVRIDLHALKVQIIANETLIKVRSSKFDFRSSFLSGVGSTSLIAAKNIRHYYSIFSLIAQYLVPFLTITTLYGLIFLYLKRHRIIKANCSAHVYKARRTNVMLASISFVFCLCWFPLNLFLVIGDSTDILHVRYRIFEHIYISQCTGPWGNYQNTI
jgi:hypothetical protein